MLWELMLEKLFKDFKNENRIRVEKGFKLISFKQYLKRG